MSFWDRIRKNNPYPDAQSRFASTDGGGASEASGYRTDASDKTSHNEAVANSATPAQTLSSQYPPNSREAEILSRSLPPEGVTLYKASLAQVEANMHNGDTLSRYFDEKTGKWDPERAAAHSQIAANEMRNWEQFKPPAGQAPEVMFLGGRGGSGKSSFEEGSGKLGLYDSNKFYALDADKLKAQLPGYSPDKAAEYHEESSYLTKMMLDYAAKEGINVTFYRTMSSDTTKFLSSFEGYKTSAYYMHVTADMSAERALGRWWNKGEAQSGNSGRLVPISVILSSGKNEANFDAMTKKVDKWGLYSNDVPKGTKPIKLAGN